MGRASRAVAFGAVFALLVSACTGGGTPTPRPNATESPIPRGGTLRVGLFHWNRDFPYDPATFWTFEILSIYPCCLLRTLYYYNGRSAAEGGGELRPDLATGPPEVSSDGLTWTFHIRLGLHYAPPLQRVEITASDFVRAIERQLSPAPKEFHSPNGLLGFGSSDVLVIEGAQDYADGKSDRISGLEAPDSHTLRIRLTEPDGDFPFRLSLVGTTPIPPNRGPRRSTFPCPPTSSNRHPASTPLSSFAILRGGLPQTP